MVAVRSGFGAAAAAPVGSSPWGPEVVAAAAVAPAAPVPDSGPWPSATDDGEVDGPAGPVTAEPVTAESVTAEPVQIGRLVDEPGSEPVAAASVEDPLAWERRCRAELAIAADPTEVALALAAWLCDQERHGEADAVLAAAVARVATPALRIARAGVWRDLGQRHLAVGELAALIAEHGAAAVHPGLLLELAELHCLEGEPLRAAEVLQQLRTAHAADAWVVRQQPRIEAFAVAIEQPGGPRRVVVRDLLGNLRGAPVAATRLAALESLASDAPVPEAARQPLHEQAIAIAVGDESPAVRARAIELAQLPAPVLRELLLAALEDPAALVRGCAAGRAAAHLTASDLPQLRTWLADESDPTAFARLHAALRAFEPLRPPLPPGGAATAAGRAAAAAWGQS